MADQQQLQDSFGKALKDLRLSRNISQEGLALECGLDRTFISMLERGLRQPSLASIFSIAEALEIKPSTLIKRQLHLQIIN